MKIETQLIHAGIEPDPSTGAIMTPIFQTSTYVQDGKGGHKGFEYARTQNPTRAALEANLAAIEQGKHAICFGSGLAAIDAILRTLQPGDEVISTNDLYGGTYRLITRVHGPWGLKSQFVDMNNLDLLEAAITPNTKLLWIETPTNPMINIIDIASVVKIAKKHNLITCVDNTFASPYLQNPLTMGVDIVMHSATKYIGGHSDVIHGAVITSNDDIAAQLRFLQNAVGAIPGPQDCFLILRGLKTLHVRVKAACENAMIIAQRLQNHPAVDKVYFPGLPSHPQHDFCLKQMRMYGAMISFNLKTDTIEAAEKILSSTHLFACAESLGGVESLIGHPAIMTHASIPREERLKVGLSDSLIRLSIGIEDADDLWSDLEKALNQA
jgi:cystathionine gamma-lyase